MRKHALLGIFSLCAVPALAHIELDIPLVRHDNGDNGDSAAGEINKVGPCGLGGAGDVRNASRVTMLTAGSQLLVTWRETIGHTGRMRIAFAPNGNLQSDFDANVLVDIDDPSGGAGNTGDGNHWESVITLPSAPCDNCTLQVIQQMSGTASTCAIDDDCPGGHRCIEGECLAITPTPNTTYFQCADLILVGGEGEGEGEPGEGEGEPGEGEGEPGEGEGEGEPGEGEGEPAGEGEGEPVGEGEGEPAGEGEGEAGEGEGEPAGEGESEPSDDDDDDDSETPFSCASPSARSAGLWLVGLVLLGHVGRRRGGR
jgi:hypothetical protein